MKIRIRGNTLRYRLSKSDVAKLAETGSLIETTAFITGMLTYAIERSENESLSADLVMNTITLYVPGPMLMQWASSDQVGMENTIALLGGDQLYLLLEKDFKCIDGDVSEDQSDFFENPNLTC